MESMSLTPEELERRESAARMDSDKVDVRVGVIIWNGMVMPVADEIAERFEKAVFKRMTVGDNEVIEKIVSYKGQRPDGKPQMLLDVFEYKRMLLKKNLLSWTLGVPVNREDGWVTRECYKKIAGMSGTLVGALVEKYEDSMIIDDAEEALIDRQAAILFGKNSGGVADPCKAVSLYCNLERFSEKFGIGREELDNMSYKDFKRLRIMSSKEAVAGRVSAAVSKTPVTKIASGGRTRQSRGVVVGRS